MKEQELVRDMEETNEYCDSKGNMKYHNERSV